MLGADTFVSALLRIVGTVAVLAAVYFFIVKPVLHTTEKVSHDASRQSQQNQRIVQRNIRRAQRQANRAVRQAGLQAHQATIRVQKATHGQAGQANLSGLPKDARRVIRCLQNANGNVTKLQRCH